MGSIISSLSGIYPIFICMAIKLRELLNESIDNIGVSDIYNFYYLFALSVYHPQTLSTDYGRFIQDEYLKKFKAKYVSIFKRLVVEQLQKYYSRKRIDPDFDINKANVNSPAQVLQGLMKKTWRSDMVRRNESWELVCDFLTNLENSSSTKDTYLYVDRLNSVVHNTQTKVLDKMPGGYQLIRAYNQIHRAKSVSEYEQFVDKDIRQLNSQDEMS